MKGYCIQVCLDSNVLILALILDLVGVGGFSDRHYFMEVMKQQNCTHLVSYRDPVSSSLEESRLIHFM